MPMVRHDAVRKKRNVAPVHRFLEQSDEGGVVTRIFEKNRTFGCSVEYMEDQARGSFSYSSRHGAVHEATSMPWACDASVLEK